MLDQRLQNIVKRKSDHYIWLAHQPVRFYFSNEFSEKLIIQKMNQLLQKLDQINGAPVPDRVLMRGIPSRPDDRSRQEKFAQSGLSYNNQTPDDRNPHLIALKEYDQLHGDNQQTHRDKIVADAEAWEAEREAERAREAMYSDPQWRARHVAAGEAFLVMHYTRAPMSEYQLAAARLAATNDPEAFAEVDAKFKERQRKRLAEAEARINAERAKVDAELETLGLATEAKQPSAEAWALARKEVTQLRQSGYFPQAREEIEALYAGVHAGTIEPREANQRVQAIRDVASATN